MKKLQFLPFTLFSIAAYLPYIMFIIIGNHYDSGPAAWLPVLVFYLFRYTGSFLLASFYFFESQSSNSTLKVTTLISAIACFIGILAPINTIFLLISAIILGLSSSVQLPLYLTALLHEHEIEKKKVPFKNSIESLVAIFLLVPFFIILAQNELMNLVALLYGTLYFLSYFIIKKNPSYPLRKIEKRTISWDSLLIFILASFLIIVVKTASYNFKNGFLLLTCAIVLTLLFFIPIITKKNLQKGYFHKQIYYLSAIIGAIINFYFLYGTFYALSQKDYSFLIYNVYLAYIIGTIISRILGIILFKKFKENQRTLVLMVLISLGLILTLFPSTISFGGLLIGITTSIWGKRLNRYVYFNSVDNKDIVILSRSRWAKMGSIFNQIILLLLTTIFAIIFKLTNLSIFDYLEGSSISKTNGFIFQSSILVVISYIIILFVWYFKGDQNIHNEIFRIKAVQKN